jgi:MerR family transcriptional regulator, redox-sensitive transcriptional activator SoxR
MGTPGALNIGEVARQAGIQSSAIRYYESLGLLSAPKRASGWRLYEPNAVDQVRVIRAARDLGFSLDDIRTLLRGFPTAAPAPERWQKLARKKLPEIEATIQRAQEMKRLLESGLNCECVSIEQCFLEGCGDDNCDCD